MTKYTPYRVHLAGMHGPIIFFVDEDGIPHLSYLDIEIVITRSSTDGTRLVEIDTTGSPEDDNGPQMRIYLNDYTLHENPPYPGE